MNVSLHLGGRSRSHGHHHGHHGPHHHGHHRGYAHLFPKIVIPPAPRFHVQPLVMPSVSLSAPLLPPITPIYTPIPMRPVHYTPIVCDTKKALGWTAIALGIIAVIIGIALAAFGSFIAGPVMIGLGVAAIIGGAVLLSQRHRC
jgi:hypothetical protein